MRSMNLAAVAAASGLSVTLAGSAHSQLLYEWSPQNTRTHLTGTLAFLPTDNNGGSFQ
jgi:hypothetical protein